MPYRPPMHKPPGYAQARKQQAKHYELSPERKADHAFYNSAAWLKFRAWFLSEHPLCTDCMKLGRSVPAQNVHHIKERKDFPELTFDANNLEGLCVAHHSARTMAATHRKYPHGAGR